MSMKFLGESFDIHGGGKDLVFPHHENEIAQSEAANGREFVRYWLHNGFVNINSEKMSKSLGNFFTIKEVLERYDAEVLRFFLLSAHYRSPIDFCDQNLTEAETGLERIYKGMVEIDRALVGGKVVGGELSDSGRELEEKVTGFGARFREAMDDDFNTALAIAGVFDLTRAVNRVAAEDSAVSSRLYELLTKARLAIDEVAQVLGIFTSEPSEYLERIKLRKAEDLEISTDEIEQLIAARAQARKAKDFKRSDEIRDLLLSRNIALLDSPLGTTWTVK
jgi:cysteinyl-tRNA synthetase